MAGRLLPCRRGGCGSLVRGGGLCPKHRKAERQLLDRQRGSAHSRGYGRAHERWARQILNRDLICVCEGYGCTHEPGACGRPAEHADHIDGDNTNRSMDNGQGLCAGCHSRKTAKENRRWG